MTCLVNANGAIAMTAAAGEVADCQDSLRRESKIARSDSRSKFIKLVNPKNL